MIVNDQSIINNPLSLERVLLTIEPKKDGKSQKREE